MMKKKQEEEKKKQLYTKQQKENHITFSVLTIQLHGNLTTVLIQIHIMHGIKQNMEKNHHY